MTLPEEKCGNLKMYDPGDLHSEKKFKPTFPIFLFGNSGNNCRHQFPHEISVYFQKSLNL